LAEERLDSRRARREADRIAKRRTGSQPLHGHGATPRRPAKITARATVAYLSARIRVNAGAPTGTVIAWAAELASRVLSKSARDNCGMTFSTFIEKSTEAQRQTGEDESDWHERSRDVRVNDPRLGVNQQTAPRDDEHERHRVHEHQNMHARPGWRRHDTTADQREK
jgi:hypothetical protein